MLRSAGSLAVVPKSEIQVPQSDRSSGRIIQQPVGIISSGRKSHRRGSKEPIVSSSISTVPDQKRDVDNENLYTGAADAHILDIWSQNRTMITKDAGKEHDQ